MEEPLISITVCVRDGVDWVDGCLKSLTQQTYPAIEILAVDDGSSDGSTEALRQWHDPDGARGPPVRVHCQSTLGLSAGRQWALENANGDWVAITDIDVRPEPDWIMNMMAETTPVSEEERVVAVTGRTIFEQAEDTVSRLRSVEIAAKYRSRPRRTSLANGPCSMFHRSSLLAIGGFDPEWYHAEDMEVSLRLIEAGGTIVYAPDALVRHVPEIGLKRFLSKRRRDARAHVRIVRHFPKRKRAGPGFDFLGSSAPVLILLPLWMVIGLCSLPFFGLLLTSEPTTLTDVMAWWQFKVLGASFVFLLLHEILLWRGPLGVVHRGLLRMDDRSKIIVILGVRRVTFLWSIALWIGLLYGIGDALFARNGHNPWWRKSE